MSNQWQNGLCGCFNDCATCIVGTFLPCYLFGKNAESVDENCLLCGLAQFVPIVDIVSRIYIRGKIRESKRIQGNIVQDLLTHWCCGCCALIQEAQEVAPGSLSMARE